MTNEEWKIYDLVVRRFMAVFFPPFQYEQTQVTVEIAGEHFVASGKIIKSQGWKEVYGDLQTTEDETENEEDRSLKDQTLPEIKEGDRLPELYISICHRLFRLHLQYAACNLDQISCSLKRRNCVGNCAIIEAGRHE